MSGLSRTPGKRVWDNIPPRVRIPLSPPGHRLQTVCTQNEHPAQRLVLRGFSFIPPDFAYPTNVISDEFWRLTGHFSRNLLTSGIWYGFFKSLFLLENFRGLADFALAYALVS